MAFEHRHRFSASLADVWAMLGDRDFLLAKYEALGMTEVTFDRFEAGQDGAHVVCRRSVPVDVPGFAKRVLGERNIVVQTEQWSRAGDGYRNRWSLDVQGAPIRIEGSADLVPEGDGCVETIRGTVQCSVPLIGGRIAKFVEGDAKKGVADEMAFGERWLGRS